MDARYYNGDDGREFGPHPDACDHCGAGPMDPCTDDCDCDRCESDREPPTRTLERAMEISDEIEASRSK